MESIDVEYNSTFISLWSCGDNFLIRAKPHSMLSCRALQYIFAAGPQ